jgi:hypothetical protein
MQRSSESIGAIAAALAKAQDRADRPVQGHPFPGGMSKRGGQGCLSRMRRGSGKVAAPI